MRAPYIHHAEEPHCNSANSLHLNYSAGRSPLRGIDGIYVINLARRPDRLQTFRDRSGLHIDQFHVLSAVDGNAIPRWNSELQR